MEEKKRKGGFQKGKSGNPSGRPKGTQNHINKELKDRFKEIVDGQMANVMDSLDRLACSDPAKHVDILTKLASFYMPKLTEDLSTQKPPIFILPAGVELPNEDIEDIDE